MFPHHQRVVERIAETFGQDKDYPAVLLGGSIARGWERSDSDVDVYIVATDELFADLQRKNALFYYNTELCDYPGGYIDGKIIPYAMLQDAAERGSEPMRASFIGSSPIYSRIPGLADVLRRIPVYPIADKEANIKAFYAQVQLLGGYFVGQALKKDNRYLLMHAVSDLVLFAGRLLLAHNERLFPGHKSLFKELANTPDKPADFMKLAEQLLHEPTAERTKALIDSIGQFRDWGPTEAETVSMFVENNEWNWRHGKPSVGDW